MIENEGATHRHAVRLLLHSLDPVPLEERDRVGRGQLKEVMAEPGLPEGRDQAHTQEVTPEPYSLIHIASGEREVVNAGETNHDLSPCRGSSE